jgi:hypothetical protein
MRRLLLSMLLYASTVLYVSTGPCLAAENAPTLSKADEAFLALVEAGKPIPKLDPLFITPGYVGRVEKVYVVQVLDDRNAVVFVGGSDYLLRGQSTSKMREFNAFTLPQPHVAIVETAACKTPWGTPRTLPVMDIVNLDAVRAALADRH